MEDNNIGTGIGAVLDAVEDIVDYASRKAAYEADQRIRSEIDRMRGALFAADSDKSCALTTELAISKLKYKCLRKRISELHPEYQKVFAVLLAELQIRIDNLRSLRNGIGQ